MKMLTCSSAWLVVLCSKQILPILYQSIQKAPYETSPPSTRGGLAVLDSTSPVGSEGPVEMEEYPYQNYLDVSIG